MLVEPIRRKKDIQKIKKILLKQNYRDYVLFCLGINSGLRISDILKLDVKDVKNKNFIQLFEKKTGKFKKFPINKTLKAMLYKYTKNKNIYEPLFTTVFNNRMDRITAYRIIKNACIKANLEENIGTHTLRKTFGYFYYKKFKNILMLQHIFNHSTPAITLRYIGIEQEQIYKNYEKFIF